MNISLPGVLERAAVRCEKARDWQTKLLAASLRELLEHLRLVRAEPDRLQEFFDLWVDSGVAERAEAAEGGDDG